MFQDNNFNKKVYEEKKITNYFLISKDKFRICYSPKGNTKKVSVYLNYHISCFGKHLKKIIELKKYDLIKIYTKSAFINEERELNDAFFSEIVVEDYQYTIFDLELIKSSQEENYSLFCKLYKAV